MKLELGMYCYDKVNRKFGIGKIVEARQNNNYVNYVVEYKNYNALISSENIIASYNIIDLIEVGDYVNGHKVVSINNTFTYAGVEVETSGIATAEIIPKNFIKTIVTKEQFENNCYKVKRGRLK